MSISETPTYAVIGAIDWLDGTLLGTAATTVAIIAVAGVGFAMFQGRVPVRRGVVVVLGCFILFSARTIANGLLDVLPVTAIHDAQTPAVAMPAYVPPAPPPVPYDPYAGASVPNRATNDANGLVLK